MASSLSDTLVATSTDDPVVMDHTQHSRRGFPCALLGLETITRQAKKKNSNVNDLIEKENNMITNDECYSQQYIFQIIFW